MFPLFRRAVFFFTWHFVIKKKKRKGKEKKRTNVTITFRVLFCRENKQAEGNGGRTVGMSSAIVVPPFFFIISEYYYNNNKEVRERERVNQRTVCTRASPAAQEGPSSSSLFVSRGGRKRKTSKIWQKHAITFDTCSVMQVHALFLLLLLLLLPIHFHMMQRASERPEFNHRKVFFFLVFFFFVFSNFPF